MTFWTKKMNDEDIKNYYLEGYKKTNRPKPCNSCVFVDKCFECKHCVWFYRKDK